MFSVDEEPVPENDILPKIQQLIDSGKGDPGRLQHIYDMLAKNSAKKSSKKIKKTKN